MCLYVISGIDAKTTNIHIEIFTLNNLTAREIFMNFKQEIFSISPIPTKWVGPIHLKNTEFDVSTLVPLATLEKPLWNTVARGAKITTLCDGLNVNVIHENMTRSIVVESDSSAEILQVVKDLPKHLDDINAVIAQTSRFAKLLSWHEQFVGNLLFLRLEFNVGEASGHNMATKASEAVLNWLLEKYKSLRYISISGNTCVDKKVSAINGILGRGKHVIADLLIPEKICKKILRINAKDFVNLHTKKNLIGSILAGSVHSANAHFANMLLGLYLATGQDVANIVEGSQGITHAEDRNGDLYFSVTLPNIIVGTIGSGKDNKFAYENLQTLGCIDGNRSDGFNSRKLACIIASSVWCGELSLLSAQVNRGELVKSHMLLERRNK